MGATDSVAVVVAFAIAAATTAADASPWLRPPFALERDLVWPFDVCRLERWESWPLAACRLELLETRATDRDDLQGI